MSLRAVTLAVVLFACAAMGAVRHVVVLTNDVGFADEPKLRFAESDGALVVRTLRELGAVEAEHAHHLKGGSLAQVQRRLELVLQGAQPADELLLFISGHAGPSGLHWGAETWAWAELQRTLDGVAPQRALAFVDACHSGAMVTPKGLSLGAPLSVRVESTVRGRWLVTSSGANELSYESKRLGGSPFLHAVVSGLRGGADADADGRVTADELYAFTFARTLASSLSEGVVQRPVRATTLRGAGEWVLVQASRGTARLEGTGEGACFVLDAEERKVLAELAAGRTVSLAPGRYRVKCLTDGAARTAWAELAGAPVAVASLRFETSAPTWVVARGPAARLQHRLTLRGGSTLTEAGGPSGTAALGWALWRDGLSVDLSLGAALGQGRSLFTAVLSLGAVLPWWRLGQSELELGLHAGTRVGLAGAPTTLLLGQHTQLWWPFGDGGWRALARLDIGTGVVLGRPAPPEAVLTLTVGVAHHFD